MSSRLYRTIIAFGTSLGVGGATVAVVSVTSGCDLYFGGPKDGPHGIIDAGWGTIADAPWGFIDASRMIDAHDADVLDARDGAVDAGIDASPDATPPTPDAAKSSAT